MFDQFGGFERLKVRESKFLPLLLWIESLNKIPIYPTHLIFVTSVHGPYSYNEFITDELHVYSPVKTRKTLKTLSPKQRI